MLLKEQKQRFPVGSSVTATADNPPYYFAGDHGVVVKHYGRGSIYVRFARSSSALSTNGSRDWFAAPEELVATPASGGTRE